MNFLKFLEINESYELKEQKLRNKLLYKKNNINKVIIPDKMRQWSHEATKRELKKEYWEEEEKELLLTKKEGGVKKEKKRGKK